MLGGVVGLMPYFIFAYAKPCHGVLPCSLNPRQPGFLGHKELQAQQPPARELSQAELAWGAARGYNFAATSQQPQQLGQQQCKGMQQQQQSMVAEHFVFAHLLGMEEAEVDAESNTKAGVS